MKVEKGMIRVVIQLILTCIIILGIATQYRYEYYFSDRMFVLRADRWAGAVEIYDRDRNEWKEF